MKAVLVNSLFYHEMSSDIKGYLEKKKKVHKVVKFRFFYYYGSIGKFCK
ncbi:hypothetical protein HMPREF0556_10127 [Listeria grayi DSM 20601]|uniref:Uncharacterized protein n=1 Tax=Listeria grayi DSM 20601 TaxID=525367 RepID=D7UUK2_LISGR|nr:hypothetical protein HMPREF0556_10127 [Listeria grayi DSM 20601]